MAGARLVLVDAPAMQYVVARLRSRDTPRWLFRQLMETAGVYLGYEASRLLPTRRVVVETPLGRAEALEPRDDETVIVAVLRAALPLAWGMLRSLPRAELGLAAARRLEDAAERGEDGAPRFRVETGYQRLPRLEGRTLILADPMLATASTLEALLPGLARRGPERVIVASLIASRTGVERALRLLESLGYTDSRGVLMAAAVDPELDERGFIVPGLGDAGDRALGEAW